jgi:transitional endoplasmic reticulum ATPase
MNDRMADHNRGAWEKWVNGISGRDPAVRKRALDAAMAALAAGRSSSEASSAARAAAGQPWTWDRLVLPEETKRELQELVAMLGDAGRASALGVAVPHGVLLTGPPGTGKTTIGRVIAQESGRAMFPVTSVEVTIRWVGESEKLLHWRFQTARAHAPSLMFFDEIDTIGRRRDSDNWFQSRQVNQLLLELDSMQSSPGVFVLAATNRPDVLDEALLRGGRFGRQIEIPLPDAAGRRHMLGIFTSTMPLDASVSLDILAQRTAGYSGADLEALCQQAAIEHMVSRGATPLVTREDFERAQAVDRPPADHWTWNMIVLPEDTRREVMELQTVIASPERVLAFGVDPPRGALLYGPPGTGKTTLAKVLAAQTRCSFYAVSGPDFIRSDTGESKGGSGARTRTENLAVNSGYVSRPLSSAEARWNTNRKPHSTLRAAILPQSSPGLLY